MMLIDLKNITKFYGSAGDPSYQLVLDQLTLSVETSETIAILGPSGSGKSTLLNIIGTLDHPDSGDYLFKDRNITGFNIGELDNFRNREIGFVFQFHHLLPQCNLIENVMIPTLMHKDSGKEKRLFAEDLLNRVGLWEHRNKMPGQLSGGECQRAAVVRAMINKPSVLLADEPTGALDGKNVHKLSELLLQLNDEENVTLILVTHSENLASHMKKIYLFDDGKLKMQ